MGCGASASERAQAEAEEDALTTVNLGILRGRPSWGAPEPFRSDSPFRSSTPVMSVNIPPSKGEHELAGDDDDDDGRGRAEEADSTRGGWSTGDALGARKMYWMGGKSISGPLAQRRAEAKAHMKAKESFTEFKKRSTAQASQRLTPLSGADGLVPGKRLGSSRPEPAQSPLPGSLAEDLLEYSEFWGSHFDIDKDPAASSSSSSMEPFGVFAEAGATPCLGQEAAEAVMGLTPCNPRPVNNAVERSQDSHVASEVATEMLAEESTAIDTLLAESASIRALIASTDKLRKNTKLPPLAQLDLPPSPVRSRSKKGQANKEKPKRQKWTSAM